MLELHLRRARRVSQRLLAVSFSAASLLFAAPQLSMAQQPDLVLNMTGAPDPVPAGGVVAYSITVLNDGPGSTATGVQVAVPVPSGASYSGFSGSGVSCTGMTVGQAGPGTVTCTLPNLPYLTTQPLTVSLKTSVSGPFPVTATATENETDLDNSNNSITVTSTVVAGADVAFSISSSATLGSGSTLSYTLSLHNLGPDNATNLVAQFPVPTGFVLNVGSLPSGCSVAANVISCTVAGPIANSATLNIGPITGQISAASGSTITASASEAVSGSAPGGTAQDPNAANSSGTFNTTVTAGSDLALAAITRSTSAPYFVGGTFNFTIIPSYTGDSPSGLTITDVIPTVYTIGSVAASQNGWSCSVVGQTVTCMKPSGGAAGSAVSLGNIVIPVTINSTGTATNTATIGATSPFDPNSANNTASDGGATLLTPTADLSVSVSGPSPALVVTNQAFTETITMSNGGPSFFFGTDTVIDHIPANVTLNSAVGSGWVCVTPPPPAAPLALPQTGPFDLSCTRTYTSGSPFNSGTNAPGIVLNMTALTAGTINNSVSLTTSGANVSDPNLGNNATSFNVSSSVPVASADIALNKTVDLPTVAAGDVLTYTLEVVNNSTTQASTNITITDDFQTLINNSTGATGAGFISFVTTANNASGVSCSTATSGSTGVKLTCTIPSLPNCTTLVNCPTIVAKVRPGGDGGARSNTASIVSSAIADPNLANNSATASNTILPRADVTVSINGTPNPVAAGQPLTYVITATNNGPSQGANVTVVDTLPLNVVFVSATPSSGSCATTPVAGALTGSANQFVTCNLGAVNNGAQKTVTIVVKPTNVLQGTSITNMTGVTTSTTEPTPPAQTNNQAQVSTNVSIPSLDLTIANVDSPDPVTVASTMTYTLTVHNIGPSDAENVVITDNLPATGLSFASATIGSGSCPTQPAVGAFGGTVICNLSRLSSGSTVIVTITMTGVTKGVVSNTATVASDETPHGWENAANNTAVQNTTVRTRTDIQVQSKTASAPTGFRRPFTYLIKVLNPTGAGLAEADTVNVTDNLPAGMVLTGTPTAVLIGGTTTTLNVCTGVAGGASTICAFGTLSSGGEVDITVPVKVTTYPAGGTITNTASVTTSSQDIDATNNSASGIATIQSSSIAGVVYRDFNANGTQDGVDTGISGITMTVTGTAFDAAAVSATATTNSSGVFNFIGLPEGTYSVSRGTAATPLLLQSVSVAGDHGGTPTPVATVPPAISGITLAQNDAAGGTTPYQFSLIPQARIGLAKTATAPTVSITDGSYSSTFQVLVKNYSLEPLTGIVVNDPLAGATPSFGTFVAGGAGATLTLGQYTINTAPAVVSCGTGTANAAFDGNATLKIADISSLAAAASCTFNFTIRWQPTSTVPLPAYSNQANGSGTGQYSAQTPSDVSQSGANPDPGSGGDPTIAAENTPTPVTPAAVADVSAVAAFPATVNAGLPVTGTVLFKNFGPYQAQGVTYTLTLSANLTGVSFSNLPGGATATYVSGTGVVTLASMPTTLNPGAIASGDGATGIVVNYNQNATASSTVHSVIATTTSEGGNAQSDIGNATVGGLLIADVTTSMTFPASIDAGNSVVGHVVYKNTGPSVASGLTYTMTLSPNLTGVSFANLPGGAGATYTPGTGVVVFTGMPATANLNQILSADGVNGIQVTYTQNATASSTVASTIATTTNEGTNTNTNSASAAIGGQLVADVTTTLTFPGVANAGVPVTGTIIYKNNGPSIASGVTYTLNATANLTGVSFSNLPGGATATYVPGTGLITLAGMPVTLNAAQIASGDGTTGIVFNYTQTAVGTSQINSTIATTTNQGANAAPDAAAANPGGVLIADVTTSVTFPASVNAGQPVSGTVLYRNNGPSIASGVTYALTLAANLTGVSFSNLPGGATATYVPGTGVVTLASMPATIAIGAIASGDGVTGITVNYTQNSTASSTITSTIATTTSQGADALANSANTTVGGALIADVTTSLVVQALVNAGQVVKDSVVFRNTGPSIASGLTYSVTLSANLTGVSFGNLPGGATATYVPGTGAVTFGSMPATATPSQILSGDGVHGIAINYTQNATPLSTIASTIATATSEGANANPNSASGSTGGSPIADVTTSLNFPVVANAGVAITGTIVYTNTGPSTAVGMTYTLSATPNLTGVSFSNLPGGATATYVPGTGVITLAGMPTTLTLNQIASGNGTTGIVFNYTQTSTGVSQINSGIGTTTSQGANAALDAAAANPGGGLIADMTTILTFPALVNAGQPVSGTVLYRNNGPSIASGVTYSLTLATGLTGVSFSNLPAGVTASYVSGTGVVTLTGMPATVAIGAVVSGDGVAGITVNYIQNSVASSTIVGNITTTTSEGANLAPNNPTTTVGGALIADVTTSVAFPTITAPGITTTGKVVYRNNGPSISSGMSYSLLLATGLGPVSFANLPGGAAGAYNALTGVVTFTGMPATLSVNGIASNDGINGITVSWAQPVLNTPVTSVIATTTNEGLNAARDSATATILGFQFVDLKVTKTDGVTQVLPGAATVYTVRVLNNGGANLTGGSTVTDVPNGMTLLSVACSTVANNRCITAPTVAQIAAAGGFSLPPLPLGGFFEFLVTAQITKPSGSVTNTASVTLPLGFQDTDSTNNSATDTDVVLAGTPTIIGIAKVASPAQPLANGHFTTTFTMKVQNYGIDALSGVRVTDPMSTAAGGSFGTFAPTATGAGQYSVTSVTATGLTANATFNGGSDPLVATGSLAVGASATLSFTVDFIPSGSVAYMNQATATGTGATSGLSTTDLSTNGTDPDPSGAGNPGGSNVPTPVEVPRIGLAKTAGPLVSNGNGTYDVTFSMVVANVGGMPLSPVQIIDTLGAFGVPSSSAAPSPGEYIITAGPTVSNQVNGASIAASPTFTGAGAGANLLAGGSSLAAASTTGAASQASVSFTIRFFPRYAGQCTNQAVVTGTTQGGVKVSSPSSNGTVPDPAKASPTIVDCHGQNIGAALLVTAPVQTGPRKFRVPYQALVRNMDTVTTATNVQLSDNVKSTFPTAQSITIVAPGTAAAAASSARANSLSAAVAQFATTTCTGTVLNLSPTPFDGLTQQLMLAGNQNLLPREQCIFNFTVEVDFGTNPIPLVAQNNQTIATTALTPGGKVIATDSSQNGPDPDPNINGTPRDNSTVTPVIFAVTPALVVTKTTPVTNVGVGQLVPYTITVANPNGANATGVDLRDMLPGGFSYRTGTASIDGVAHEPTLNGRSLDWTGLTLAPAASHVIRLMLVVGSGVRPGMYANTAQAFVNGSQSVSNVASATVRVIPDATFDCSDIIGKIFDDRNGNGVQDEGEHGIPGVRVISARGWIVTADAEGRFHIACAAIPDPERGSNFVMKLDERTLPAGYVLTTENPRSIRLTDGKMSELNFGAAMRKVANVDLTADAFSTGTAQLTPEWQARLDTKRDSAGPAAFVLRVSYTATSLDEPMARERLSAVVALIRARWREKPWYKSMQIEQSLVYLRKPEGGR